MRVFLIVLLLTLHTQIAFALSAAILGDVSDGSLSALSGCAGATEAACQDMEGVGTPAGWSVVNTPDFDQDTTGLDMELTKAIRLDATDEANWTHDVNGSEVWHTFKWRVNDTLDAQETLGIIKDTANAVACTFLARTDGTFRVTPTGGSTSSSTAETCAASNSCFFKIRYKQGTGANAECGISVWTGAAFGAEVSQSDGTRTTQADAIFFDNNADTETMYIDFVKVDTSDIGDPTP